MLLLDLYRVFEDKGIENPHRFLRQNGFTAHTTSRLLNNKVDSISFKHLEQICLLLNCSVEDLFSWQSEDKTGMYKNHVMQKLKRGKSKGSITSKLKQLPLDKLNEVRNYIDQLSNNDKTI
jgi:DNA-binding Xre family transcriptional regulator